MNAAQVEHCLKVNVRCQVTWNWAGCIAPTPCSRGRSTRLWSLLHSYGRLQRWNVRPVNTEGRKNQPIWHEHYRHTMNTPKCEITKHRRHQALLCNGEKKQNAALVKKNKKKNNYAWWCMQNEGKSPLGWMQWLCNICMHTVKSVHSVYESNGHASATLLLLMKTVHIQTSGYITASQAQCDTFLAKKKNKTTTKSCSGLQTGVTLTS